MAGGRKTGLYCFAGGPVAERIVLRQVPFLFWNLSMWKNPSYYCNARYSKADPEANTGADRGNILLFQNYAVFNRERWVCNRPFSCFIQYFFRLKANPRKNNSTRTFAFPRVKNLRKPKSVFKSPNAPST